MLKVKRSVPLQEGLELVVKDNKSSPSLTSSGLNHRRHMGIAGFGFAITACMVLIGCGIGIIGSLWLQDQHSLSLSLWHLASRYPCLLAIGVGPYHTQVRTSLSPRMFGWPSSEGLHSNRGWILLHHPRPLMLGAGSEASSPHGCNLSWDLTQKVRTKEVLCLLESLGFYTKSLARGRFLFLISPPSCLDYGGRHLPPEELRTFAEFPFSGCSLQHFSICIPLKGFVLILAFVSQPQPEWAHSSLQPGMSPQLFSYLWPKRERQNLWKSCKWMDSNPRQILCHSSVQIWASTALPTELPGQGCKTSTQPLWR